MKSAREMARDWFAGREVTHETLIAAIEERDDEKIALFRAVVETVERAWRDRGYQAAFDALLARPEFQLSTPPVDPWIEAAWTEWESYCHDTSPKSKTTRDAFLGIVSRNAQRGS